MTKRNLKFFSYLLITIFLTLGLSISFQSLLADWTAPLATPPNCTSGNSGCDAPLHAGLFPQSKSGPLTINYLNGATTGLVAYGNVGIGTADPGAKLELAGQIKITGGTPGAGKVLTSDATGLASWGSSATSQWITAGSNIYYNTGNVGIGTSTPVAPLEIIGGSGTILILRGQGGGVPIIKVFSTSSGGQELLRVSGDVYNNTLLGAYAGGSLSSGIHNTLIGFGSGIGIISGNDNTVVGYDSQRTNVSGKNNVSIGASAGYKNNGSDNVFIGYQAGYNETSSSKLYIANSSTTVPLIYGDFALGRVGIGTASPGAKLELAGQIKITGGTPGAGKVLTSDATGLAAWAAPAGSSQWITSGSNIYYNTGNVGIGTAAPNNLIQVAGLINFDDSKLSTFLGTQAGNVNAGLHVTAIGYQALYFNTTGYDNTAIGYQALYFNTTGGNANTASGFQALFSNTTGDGNVASGWQTLYSNTTGNYNTANGNEALYKNTIGNNNTASGWQTLYSNTTGNYNTAIGTAALFGNTTGNYNTAIGTAALTAINTGNNNTAVGVSTLQLNSTGYNNTASGYQALFKNTTGYNNTASGYQALFWNTSGNQNVALGYGAGFQNITGDKNVFLGYGAGYDETGSNKLYIANSSGTPPLIYGDFAGGNVGIGTTAPAARLDLGQLTASTEGLRIKISATTPYSPLIIIKADGTDAFRVNESGNATVAGTVTAQSFIYSSDKTLKQDIKTIPNALDKILQLKGVKFNWRENNRPDLGLIAQEVKTIFPELVQTNPVTNLQSVEYGNLVAPIIEAIKEQQKQLEKQKGEKIQLQQQIDDLKNQIEKIKNR